MKVSAIMPCKGRVQQTLDVVPRLLGAAGYDDWELICVCDEEPTVAEALKRIPNLTVLESKARIGYWNAMRLGSGVATGAIICNLANDLLPCYQWLGKAMAAYRATFKDGVGMLGFNDGVQTGNQSAHFLIAKTLLQQWYGNALWPICYDHMHGDKEISLRARAEGKYVTGVWAVLFHNHYVNGNNGDAIYQLGHARLEEDSVLFELRKAKQWPPLT